MCGSRRGEERGIEQQSEKFHKDERKIHHSLDRQTDKQTDRLRPRLSLFSLISMWHKCHTLKGYAGLTLTCVCTSKIFWNFIVQERKNKIRSLLVQMLPDRQYTLIMACLCYIKLKRKEKQPPNKEETDRQNSVIKYTGWHTHLLTLFYKTLWLLFISVGMISDNQSFVVPTCCCY